MKNMQTHIIEVSICRHLYMDTLMIDMRLHILHLQSVHDSANYMLSRSVKSNDPCVYASMDRLCGEL